MSKMVEPFPLAPSLWAATAVAAPATPPLEHDMETEFCIIGGGYAGLSTALHLAEAGEKPVVLEAREPGWGGSGRNGGQVIPGLKHDPDDMVATFGAQQGEKLLRFASSTADCVFELIEKYKMEVPHARNGWIQAAHSDQGLALAKNRAAQWSKHGVAAQLLNREQTANHLGTTSYKGGWLDPRGGSIQPLSYARGLVRAAQTLGAVVHGQTNVVDVKRHGDRYRVLAQNGRSVSAKKIILCTNAYSGNLVPGLRRTIMDVNSFQIATAPLSDNLRKSILPYGQISSDTRKLLLYFRLDHTGRFLMGGRGSFREPAGDGDWVHLERVVGKMFPQLKGIPFEFRWGGRVAVTRDFLPHIHEPEPGFIVDIGCMGRGVGLQTAMGKRLAAYALTGDTAELPLPITAVAPILFHPFRRLGLAAIIAFYRFQDGGVTQT
jgi:glycine/D-amino acid oxidase-like deaminating enzyme